MPIQLIISEALQVTETVALAGDCQDSDISITFNFQTIPLRRTHAERTLTNLFMHIRARINPARITDHLRNHQSTTVIDSSCPCCKLEGRLHASQGRRAASQTIQRIPSTGTVQVRRVPAGLSGAQIIAAQSRKSLWEDPKQPQPSRKVKQRIEDLI